MKIHGTAKGGALSKKDFGVAFGGGAAPASLSDTSLKVYWKFNESSSPVVNKSEATASLGTAADMVVSNGTFSQSGIIGNALQFNGTSTNGVVGTSKSQFNFLNSEAYDFTINLWFKKSNAAENLNQQILSTRTSDTGATIQFNDVTTEEVIGVRLEQNTNLFMNGDPLALPQDINWHMLTFKGKADTDEVSCQLDNGTAATISEGGTPPSGTKNSDNVMNIGKNSGGDTYWFKGLLDEFSIWNRVLDNEEVDILWNDGDGFAIY